LAKPRGTIDTGRDAAASGQETPAPGVALALSIPGVFVETIVLPRPEWERGQEYLRYTTDPPEALIASIAWDSGDGNVTAVNVWETPGAIADFFVERVRPFVEAEGEPTNKPQRHGEPLAFYLRR
jgi:hypothetical protein